MTVSTVPCVTVAPLASRQTRAFIAFPWQVYIHDHLWVPPLLMERKAFLDPRHNPFFQHAQVQLFMAYRAGQPVGRIAAVLNALHDQFHNERAGFFGLFECLPDAQAATALLAAAAAWVRERGATFLRGPVNLSTNELDCGLLVEGFGCTPIFHASYNPPYYMSLLEDNGFRKCKDLLAFYRHYYPLPGSRVQQALARRQTRSTVTLRGVNMRDFASDIARITAIYNEALSTNWGFVPITDAEALHMAKALRPAVIPELTLLAEIDGEPVGCMVALPDLNQELRRMNGRLSPWGIWRLLTCHRRTDTIRIALTGVKQRYRRLGIDLLLYAEIWEQAAKRGILHGEAGWILEENTLIIRAMEALGCVPYKRFRLYQKALE